MEASNEVKIISMLGEMNNKITEIGLNIKDIRERMNKNFSLIVDSQITTNEKLDKINDSIEEIKLDVNRLYLKIEENQEEKVDLVILPILSKYRGNTNVLLYYAKDKVTKMAPGSFKVEVSDILLTELKNVLGEENVKCVF